MKLIEINLTKENDHALLTVFNDKIVLKNGEEEKEIGGRSREILLLLLENINRNVYREAFLTKVWGKNPYVNDPIVAKTMRRLLIHYDILSNYIKVAGRGINYHAKFDIDDSYIVKYVPNFRHNFFQDEPYTVSSREFNRSVLPSSDTLNRKLLPQCQWNEKIYSCFSDMVFQTFMKDASAAFLVLSSISGGGKTWSLYDTCHNAGRLDIPVFYVNAAAGLIDSEDPLTRYFAQKAFGISSPYEAREELYRYLSTRKQPVLFLLDGTSEVSISMLHKCIRDVKRIINCVQPGIVKFIFATRFTPVLRAGLGNVPVIDAQLLSAPLQTPLLRRLVQEKNITVSQDASGCQELFSAYFSYLERAADQLGNDSWIYDLLRFVAWEEHQGKRITSNYLKKICSDTGEFESLHTYFSAKEIFLEHEPAAEKLKSTGFLLKGDDDTYVVHPEYRDFLAVQYMHRFLK